MASKRPKSEKFKLLSFHTRMQARKSRLVNGGNLTSAITCTWPNPQFRHPGAHGVLLDSATHL
ncbi:hypothetical protein A2U01_0110055, partial [Trifolium medium]|nr:hypothetical protein [Trifolium medium]